MKLWLVNGPYDTLHLQKEKEEDPKSHKAEACSTNDTSGNILGSGRTQRGLEYFRQVPKVNEYLFTHLSSRV